MKYFDNISTDATMYDMRHIFNRYNKIIYISFS